MLPRFNRLILSFMIVILLTVSAVLADPGDAHADTVTNLIKYKGDLLKVINKLPNNEKFLAGAKDFLETSPQQICRAYWDQRNGTNSSQWDALLKGAEAAVIIGQAMIAASAAGAGPLTGYAGIASAVSTLGLGPIVTATAATFFGSSAIGAAATSVVTSAVGGPFVMAAVITSILASAVFAANYLAWTVAAQLGDWALQTCR
jgi:hypothetical protein